MASIRKELVVPAPPAAVWDAVRDFGAVHDRLARGFVTATTLDGSDRVVTFANGRAARERLVSMDDGRRRLVYAIVDSGLDLRHHQSSVEVDAASGGDSRVIWTTDVLPDEAAEPLEQAMERGLGAIARTLQHVQEAPSDDAQPRPGVVPARD